MCYVCDLTMMMMMMIEMDQWWPKHKKKKARWNGNSPKPLWIYKLGQTVFHSGNVFFRFAVDIIINDDDDDEI